MLFRSEVAERGHEAEQGAGHDAGPDRRQGDAPEGHPLVGAEVLRGKAKVELRADTLPAPRRERGERKTTAAVNTDLDPADATLLVHLKDLRRSLATGAGVPTYVVFPDRTLLELAARRPKSLEQMRAIHGVGAAKLARYGETFLQAIAGAA